MRSECAASTALILSHTLFLASADGAWPRMASLPFSTWTLLTCTFCAYISSSTDWYFFFSAASCCASPVPPLAPPSVLSLSKIPIESSDRSQPLYTPPPVPRARWDIFGRGCHYSSV